MHKKDFWIQNLQLQPHPEGGYYREVFRSDNQVFAAQGNRTSITSIYFLMGADDKSHFHILCSDELWYFHEGCDAIIHTVSNSGEYNRLIIGPKKDYQVFIPANTHFAAQPIVNEQYDYILVSCAVGPGFDFEDFQLSKKTELNKLCPGEKELIESFSLLD